ncbi:hypothetical protein ID866_7221 [Astraeus odoratus]|nr:hypothetical protein ID866_7221 [Astraeus odoratus]
MTYPGFPFPPGTPLLTLHEDVECYHRDYATRYGLWSHIKLNHTVMLSTWVGTQHAGHWDVTINDNNGDEIRRSFDHLVVASGHNLAPHIPVFPGQNAWLENTSKEGRRHEILHSLWYREPTRYTNQTVVVVGGGGGGIDIASQLTLHARKVYHAIRTLKFPTTVPVEIKLQIAYFTPDEIVFADGTSVRDVDSVVLGTGYDLRIPFLERGGELIVKPGSNQTDGSLKLITNLRYMFPLHRHIFSLSPSYPTNALAFIGLNELVPHAPADIAQSIYATCVILNGSLLAPRKELLRQLAAHEEDLMRRGYDPYYIGHRMADNSGFDYQDDLINTLRVKGALPESDDNFVEAWRREAGEYEFCVKRGWRRIEELGDEDEWMKGIETEEEWADLMRRINAWQRDWEMEHGLVFPADDIYTIEY